MRTRTNLVVRMLLGLAVFALVASWLPAQKVEIHPYVGGIPAISSADLNFGSFDFKNSDPKSRGILWEASGLYRFDLEEIKSFVAFGVGGLAAVVLGVGCPGSNSGTVSAVLHRTHGRLPWIRLLPGL